MLCHSLEPPVIRRLLWLAPSELADVKLARLVHSDRDGPTRRTDTIDATGQHRRAKGAVSVTQRTYLPNYLGSFTHSSFARLRVLPRHLAAYLSPSALGHVRRPSRSTHTGVSKLGGYGVPQALQVRGQMHSTLPASQLTFSPGPDVAACRSDSLVRLVLLETRQLSQSLSNILATLPPGLDPALAAERDLSLGAQLLTLHHAVQRNKRCLLSYHEYRASWLKRRLWERGGGLALVLEEKDITVSTVAGAASSTGAARSFAATCSTELRARLSPHEIIWLRNYSDLVTAYKAEFLDIVDVAGPLTSRSAAGAAAKQGSGSNGTSGGGTSSSVSSAGVEAGGVATAVSTYWYAPPSELMVTVVATRDARDVMTEMGTLNLRSGERMRVRRQEVEGLIVRGWLEVVDD